MSESSLWALSSSGEAEKLAVLSDAASEERLSGFMLAPDGSFFCTAYERDTAAELLLRFGPDGSEAGRWRMSELIPEGEYRGLMAVDSAGRLCVSTNVPEADCRLHVFDFSGAEPEEVCDMPLPGLPGLRRQPRAAHRLPWCSSGTTSRAASTLRARTQRPARWARPWA